MWNWMPEPLEKNGQRGFTSGKNLARRPCSVLSFHPRGAAGSELAMPALLQRGPRAQGSVSGIGSDGRGMLWSKCSPGTRIPTALLRVSSQGKEQREWLSDSRAQLTEFFLKCQQFDHQPRNRPRPSRTQQPSGNPLPLMKPLPQYIVKYLLYFCFVFSHLNMFAHALLFLLPVSLHRWAFHPSFTAPFTWPSSRRPPFILPAWNLFPSSELPWNQGQVPLEEP